MTPHEVLPDVYADAERRRVIYIVLHRIPAFSLLAPGAVLLCAAAVFVGGLASFTVETAIPCAVILLACALAGWGKDEPFRPDLLAPLSAEEMSELVHIVIHQCPSVVDWVHPAIQNKWTLRKRDLLAAREAAESERNLKR